MTMSWKLPTTTSLSTSLSRGRDQNGKRDSVNEWQPSTSLAIRTSTVAPVERLFNTSMSLKEVHAKKKRPSIVGYNWNQIDNTRSTTGEKSSEMGRESTASWTSPWLEASDCDNVRRGTNGYSDGTCEGGLRSYRSRKCEPDLNKNGDGKCELVLKVCGDGKRDPKLNDNKNGNDSSDKLNPYDRKCELDWWTVDKLGQRNGDRTVPSLSSATSTGRHNHRSLSSPASAANEHCQSDAELLGRNSTLNQTESRDKINSSQSSSAHPAKKEQMSAVHELCNIIEKHNGTTRTGERKSMQQWQPPSNSNGVHGEKQTGKNPDTIDITNNNGNPRESEKHNDVIKSRWQGANGGSTSRQQHVKLQAWLKSEPPSSKMSSTQRGKPRRRQVLDDQWWIRDVSPSTAALFCPRCAAREEGVSGAVYEQTPAYTSGRQQDDFTRGIYWKSSDRFNRPEVELPHDATSFSSNLDCDDSSRSGVSVCSLRYSDIDEIDHLRRAKSASQLQCTDDVQIQLQEQRQQQQQQQQEPKNDEGRGMSSQLRSSTPSSQLSREATGLGRLHVRTNFHEWQGKPNTIRSRSRTASGSSSAGIGLNHSMSSHSAISHLDLSFSPAASITSTQESDIPPGLSPRVFNIPIAPSCPPDPRGQTCIQSSQPSTTPHDFVIPPPPPIQPFLSGTWNARKAADNYGSRTTTTTSILSKSVPLPPYIVDSDRARLSLLPAPDVATSGNQVVSTRAPPRGMSENDDEDDEHYHKKLVNEIQQIFKAKNTNKKNHNSLPCRSKLYEAHVTPALSLGNEWATFENHSQSTAPIPVMTSSNQHTPLYKPLGAMLQKHVIGDVISPRVQSESYSVDVSSNSSVSISPHTAISSVGENSVASFNLRRPKSFYRELQQSSMTSDGRTSSTGSSRGDSRMSTASLLSCPISPTPTHEPSSHHPADSRPIVVHTGVGGVAYSLVRSSKM